MNDSLDLDPQLVRRIRQFADRQLATFDPDRVASAAMAPRPRPLWHLAATLAAAIAVVAIAVGVARSVSDGMSADEIPLTASSPSTAATPSEAVPSPTESNPPVPATGLTEEQAVVAARAAAPQAADQPLLAANAGPAGERLKPDEAYPIDPPLPADRMVWVINFGSGPPLGQQGTMIIIDLLDGSVYAVIDWIS